MFGHSATMGNGHRLNIQFMCDKVMNPYWKNGQLLHHVVTLCHMVSMKLLHTLLMLNQARLTS